MPTPVPPMPVKITRTALLAQSAVTALVASRIHWSTPKEPTYPLLVLEEIDDNEDSHTSSIARVQVNCWGSGGSAADLEACNELAGAVRSVARDLIGTWSEGDIADVSVGPKVPAHDPTGRVRFTVDLLLTLYP